MTLSTANQTDSDSTHQSNVLMTLARRLEVAKAHQDQPLVAALEYEYEQLTKAQPVSMGTRLQQLWTSFFSRGGASQ